ncbi:neurotrypsin-like [Liolophura sinensis]|uniref:neurotrypsin-like n=1 Tax=Liolophura sinensis TaxID=3198878 RepID=UPI0031582BAE
MAPDHFLVGIDCQPEVQNLTIQIDTQGGEKSGLVEVHQPDTGLVTNICGDTWGGTEATVVCREMGFDGEPAIPLEINENLLQLRQDLPVELSDVECEGSERGLEQCVYPPLGYGACEETRGKAGVVCSTSDVGLRISPLGSTGNHEGWVEINLLGRWWDAVHPMWTGAEATVFCRSLGYRWGAAGKGWFGRKGRIKGVWSLDGGCSGHEASFTGVQHFKMAPALSPNGR